MKKLLLYLFTTCIGLIQMANAQTITGTVTGGDDGEPLPGVNIKIKGTTQGTITDFDGKYTLDVSGEDAVLVFSFVGFVTQEQTVGSNTTIDVVLAVDATGIDEVVVVGYGTQKRSEVTGAITSVGSEELTSVPTTTTEQALQGRAAGVTVVNNGSPGSAATVRIRGLSTVNANDPLIVIDGVVSTGMSDLNPNDIESIQVLKDASTTAIYGSKGSNGVIMITTKKGTVGKVKVDFDASWGQQWNNSRFDLLNREQYLEYAASPDITAPPPIVADPVTYANRRNWADTDWQDNVFQKGLMSNYNLGISGGGESSTFRLSMGYVNTEGIMIGTNYERYNFRANSDYKIGRVKIGENVAISYSKRNPETNSGGRSIFEHVIKIPPYLPVYSDYNPGGFQGPNTGVDGQDAENPVRAQLLPDLESHTLSIIGNIYGELEIIDGLKFKTVAGLERTMFDNSMFTPSYNDDNLGATHFSDKAITSKATSTYTSLIYTNSLNYKKTFAEKHNLELLALLEYSTVNRNNIQTSSSSTITDAVIQVGGTSDLNATTSSDEYIRFGYLGRINYNYASKYIFAASMRRDASSRFGKNQRIGTFPSVALGWKINNEEFMQNVPLISNLKLRGSWGKTGNDLTGNYAYSTGLTNNMNYVINDIAAQGTTVAGVENPNLKWEETTMTNVGLDLGLLDDQFTLAFEYYKSQSDDLLMNMPISDSFGTWYGNMASNVGTVKTNGIELQLGYNDFEGDFQWSANLNLSTYKNEVVSLGNGVKSIAGAVFENDNISRLEPGKPMFFFYGWKFDGIFSTQAEADAYLNGGQDGARGGDFRIVDVAGPDDANGNPTGPDGVIDDNDRTEIGNPNPDFSLGFNFNANYKGFDLNIFIQGTYGNDICNTNIFDLEGMDRLFNAGTAVLRRWRQDGDVTDVPRAGGGRNAQISTRYIEDGSYTRLKNITLGYTIPTSLFKDKVSKFRVYVGAQNLLTLTKYSGLDPEIGNYSPGGAGAGLLGNAGGGGVPGVNFGTGIDRGAYPMPKSFIAGLQITF